jgi:type III secretion protein U
MRTAPRLRYNAGMSDEKTEEPTSRKLQKARDKGEVWKSTDVTHTAQFAAMLLLGWLAVDLYVPKLRELFDLLPLLMAQLLAESADTPADQTARVALEHGVRTLLMALVPVIVVPLAVGIFVVAMQVRGVFSMEPMSPKPERMNPGTNLKRLVSTRNLIDLSKTLVKVMCVGTAIYVSLRSATPQWLTAVEGSTPQGVAALLGRSLGLMGLACLALYVFIAAVDYGHQYYEYMKQQRMSKEEVRREYKEIEGDPYIKGHRRALSQQMATEEPAAGLSQAKVVITNPTHLSVALAYDAASGGLPRVVAKGAGPAAMAIRHQARRLGIPLVENKPLARKLHAEVGVGAFITADTFADVARLLATVPKIMRATSDSWGRV